MLDKTKTDGLFGKKIQKLLTAKGVETPLSGQMAMPDKLKEMSLNFQNILSILGMDLTDDSLIETPKRLAKMYLNELFWGLDYNNFPRMMEVSNKMSYDSMVIQKDIPVMSVCEHHFQPIVGSACIAYIPNKGVTGLSKLDRLVEFFSRRPQVQERLNEQIYWALTEVLGTKDVAVVIDVKHYCMVARGVEHSNGSTVTSRLGGRFKTDSTIRMEYLTLIK